MLILSEVTNSVRDKTERSSSLFQMTELSKKHRTEPLLGMVTFPVIAVQQTTINFVTPTTLSFSRSRTGIGSVVMVCLPSIMS